MNNTTQAPAQQSSVVLKITVAVILVLILGGLVWLGRGAEQAQRGGGGSELTTAEREAILENLRNTKAPELTEEERATILESLQNTR